jgi:hypothetical protein
MDGNLIDSIHSKIVNFFIDGFQELLISHTNDNHNWFYGKSVLKTTQTLKLKTDIVIFTLMGANKQRPQWKSIEDYDLQPASKVITDKYIEIVENSLSGKTAEIKFTDNPLFDGNFKVYVSIKNKITGDIKKNTYASAVLKTESLKPPMPIAPTVSKPVSAAQEITTIQKCESPAIERLFKCLSPVVNPLDAEIEKAKKELELLEIKQKILEAKKKLVSLEKLDSFEKLDSLENNNSLEVSVDSKESSLEKNSPCSSPKSLTRVSSENLIHKNVDELDDCKGNWDDMMHPPTPKKNSTPTP